MTCSCQRYYEFYAHCEVNRILKDTVHVQYRECLLSRGFHWLMQQTDKQTERWRDWKKRCLQTTLFKATFMKYSCSMLRSRTRRPTTIIPTTTKTDAWQDNGQENVGTQFVVHKLLKLLLLCRVDENAVDLRHTQVHEMFVLLVFS